MIEYDVHDHTNAETVSGYDKVDEVLSAAEVRVNLKEILYRVPVVVVGMPALFEDGTDPDSGYAEAGEIIEPRRDTLDRASLPVLTTGLCPPVPTKARRPHRCGRLGMIEGGTALVKSIAEAVGQKKVEDLVGPVDRRGVVLISTPFWSWRKEALRGSCMVRTAFGLVINASFMKVILNLLLVPDLQRLVRTPGFSELELHDHRGVWISPSPPG
jgi:hypothetical protein